MKTIEQIEIETGSDTYALEDFMNLKQCGGTMKGKNKNAKNTKIYNNYSEF